MWSDNETTQDMLGFRVHADLIINVINDETVLPVTIGVFGDWGSGKSSILKIVQEELNKDDESLILYFNGWIFEGYDDAKAALLESIIRGFEENEKISEKVKDEIKKLFKSVKWMRLLSFGFKNIALPVTTAYLSGGTSLIPFFAQQLSKLASNPKQLADNLKGDKAEKFLASIIDTKQDDEQSMPVREFRDNFSELISKSKIKKLVVIIDDLDRCTPDRIIENLEAIKLFLNVNKTAFVIGADPRLVRHAIEYRYKSNSNESRIIDDYLEKLIQIPYSLPKLSDSEVETFISLLICKKELASEAFKKVYKGFQTFRQKNFYSVFGMANIKEIVTTDEYFKLNQSFSGLPSLVPIISESLYGNPRQVKRFLNTLILRKQLAEVAKIDNFNDSVLAKLMILEYAELDLFRQLYDWQTGQDGIPKQIQELEDLCNNKSWQNAKKEIDKTEYKSWSKERVIKWLMIDPNLKNVDLRDYFWLSRDKIVSSISGIGLIPPIVKSLFTELEEDLPGGATLKIIREKLMSLSQNEKDSFLLLAHKMLKSKSKHKRYYELFHYMIDENIDGAVKSYVEALDTISIRDIEPGVATSLKKYKSYPILGEFLTKYFSENKLPASKAFNLEE